MKSLILRFHDFICAPDGSVSMYVADCMRTSEIHFQLKKKYMCAVLKPNMCEGFIYDETGRLYNEKKNKRKRER